MPIMVISGRDVNPSTAKHGPEQSNSGDELRAESSRASSKKVPEENEGETRAGGDGNEDLENGAFGVAVTNGGGN